MMTATADAGTPHNLADVHDTLTTVPTALPPDDDSLHFAAVRHLIHCAVASINTLQPGHSQPIDVTEIVGIAREALTTATMLARSAR